MEQFKVWFLAQDAWLRSLIVAVIGVAVIVTVTSIFGFGGFLAIALFSMVWGAVYVITKIIDEES